VGTSVNGKRFSRVSAEVGAKSTGSGGNLEIDTGRLSIRDGAVVLVKSQGIGNAGNLTINAHSIRLDNKATLTGDTQSVNIDPNKEQATITLHSKDLILAGGSNITTNATGNNVIGGNINIDTDVLAAVENSNIRANSTDFRGGKINITAQGIFRSSDSNITANGVNSQLNGTVQINTLGIDPTHGFVTLPTISDNTSKLVSSNCAAANQASGGSSFIVTGRGGLPPNPEDMLSSEVVWQDTRFPVATRLRSQPITDNPDSQEILPAQGWVFNDKGEVTLIAHTPNTTPYGFGSPVTKCSAR
jgi:large exoprotein involved in heme utilization and adhesion